MLRVTDSITKMPFEWKEYSQLKKTWPAKEYLEVFQAVSSSQPDKQKMLCGKPYATNEEGRGNEKDMN